MFEIFNNNNTGAAMNKKNWVIAAVAAFILGTTSAHAMFGTTTYNKPTTTNTAANPSGKPVFFYKNGKLYMQRNGQTYVYVNQGTLPADPFAAKSSVAATGPSNAKGTVVFDPKNLYWAAYDPQGNLVKTGPASGGSDYCPDIGRTCHTPVGRFTVYSEGSAACKSNTYPINNPGAPMPYCMFFSGGYAIHGSYDIPNYNASHGCVRVHPTAAAWLNMDFVKPGTTVIIKSY